MKNEKPTTIASGALTKTLDVSQQNGITSGESKNIGMYIFQFTQSIAWDALDFRSVLSLALPSFLLFLNNSFVLFFEKNVFAGLFFY